MGRKMLGAGFGDRSVVIPFNVFNMVIAQYLVYRLNYIVSYVLTGKVKNVLVTAVTSRSARSDRRSNRIIRMRAEKIGILVYHFGLEPKTELHSETVYVLDDRVKSTNQLLLLYYPVTKSRPVIIAFSKPTVVENEGVYTKSCRRRSYLLELIGGKIKLSTFPVIDNQWATSLCVLLIDKMLTHCIVELTAHTANTLV